MSLENWNNHRPLLIKGLETVRNIEGTILEFGIGEGSTQIIHDFGIDAGKKVISFENNKEYYDKFKHLETPDHKIVFVEDWSALKITDKLISLVFIDHAPAEQRHIDAIKLKTKAKIVIVHDTEHEGFDYDVYKISEIAKNFKYRLNFSVPNQVAKTVMFSNFIDVNKLPI